MKSQVLHTVWCNIAGEAAGETRNWSLLGMKGLIIHFQIKNTAMLERNSIPQDELKKKYIAGKDWWAPLVMVANLVENPTVLAKMQWQIN